MESLLAQAPADWCEHHGFSVNTTWINACAWEGGNEVLA